MYYNGISGEYDRTAQVWRLIWNDVGWATTEVQTINLKKQGKNKQTNKQAHSYKLQRTASIYEGQQIKFLGMSAEPYHDELTGLQL